MVEWIPALAGVLGGLLGGRRSSATELWHKAMADAYGRASNLVGSIDLDKEDQKTVDLYRLMANRDAMESMGNYDALRAGRGDTLEDSERGVARGTISANAARGTSDLQADLQKSRPQRKLALMSAPLQYAQAGASMAGGLDQQRMNQDASGRNAILDLAMAIWGGGNRDSKMGWGGANSTGGGGMAHSYGPSTWQSLGNALNSIYNQNSSRMGIYGTQASKR